MFTTDHLFNSCYFLKCFHCRCNISVADVIRSQYTDQVSTACLVVSELLPRDNNKVEFNKRMSLFFSGTP